MTTEQTRRDRIEAAVRAHDSRQQERISLPWRGAATTFPVISVELDIALLNPNSHRIKAQLESDAVASNAIAADPYSEDAQEAIARILRATAGYEDLKTNLHEEGQQQPGVVTRAGLLVNANTRAVALRELNRQYIRAAVLPADATPSEIDELELRLQMQREFRQDYTYTNELLFVEELITKHNYPGEDVAKALRWAPSSQPADLRRGKAKVEQATRILSVIREIQSVSGGKIPLTDFDEQRVALEELDNQYIELNARDPDAARRLKQTRILGLLVNLPYREIRALDASFTEEYLLDAAQEDELLSDCTDTLLRPNGSGGAPDDDPGGLDILDGEETPSDSRPDVTPLVELLATSRDQEKVKLPTTEGEKEVTRESVVEAVTDILQIAVDASRRADKKEDRLKKPAQRVSDADKALRQALTAFQEVESDSQFDRQKFKAVVEKAERRLDALKDALG